jgi:Tfp pilus assembly protein PilP
MRSIWKIAICAGVILSLAACGKKNASTTGAAGAEIKPGMSLSSMLEGVIPRDGDGTGEKFAYNPSVLRDPFKPFIKMQSKKKGAASVPKPFVAKTPLQKVRLDDLKLVGVVWALDNKAKALIEDPKGKGYYIGVGTYVGDRGGRITAIKPDSVIVEEIWIDPLGEEETKVITLTLHKSDNEVNP